MGTGAFQALTAFRKEAPRFNLEKNPVVFVGEDGGIFSSSAAPEGNEDSWSSGGTIVDETLEEISYVSDETSLILGKESTLCLFICGVLVENVETLAEAADTV